jgi:pimeloyl-ACP methyl ester carboxylesterase
MAMHVSRGGSGAPTMVLLHGLGATGEVWHEVASRWPGACVIPDLPGHGRSDPLPRYSFGALAAAVAAELPPADPVVVLGHSLGGVIGLTLASGWFGVPVSAVCGLGIKVQWSTPELEKAAELAARPPKVFATRDEAADRSLRVAGLAGLVPPDSPAAGAGLSEVDGGWRLSLDPAAFGVGAPDMRGLLAACRARVILAAGEHDPMSPREHLAELVADPMILPGLGHNAQVEDPAALQPILDRLGADHG